MYPYFSLNQNKTILVTEDDYENIGDIFEQSLKRDFNNIKIYYWLNSNNHKFMIKKNISKLLFF